jgi:arsenate reductase (glutaredoxin)
MTQLTLYGIKNCDTMKKARVWLEANAVAYTFHDYKTVGIDDASLQRWCARLSWEKVLNRAGTTFRKLAESAKLDLTERKAVALMRAQPSMIKRPILEGKHAGREVLLVGFAPDAWSATWRI